MTVEDISLKILKITETIKIIESTETGKSCSEGLELLKDTLEALIKQYADEVKKELDTPQYRPQGRVWSSPIGQEQY